MGWRWKRRRDRVPRGRQRSSPRSPTNPRSEPMAPERDDPLRARTQAKALQAILRRSGWYDRASLQEAAYRWAATGLPLNVIEGVGSTDRWPIPRILAH